MGRLVLLVDDDKLPLEFYVRALERNGFAVKHCLEPDSALEFMAQHADEIRAIVLDIMMPPGKAYKNKPTNEGLKTGVFLLEDIRKQHPDVPVIVLTNVRNPNTLNECSKQPCVEVVQKTECPPFELAKLVFEKMRRPQPEAQHDGKAG